VKHAGSRVHYFKEAIWDGEVVLVWRPTDDLLADLLTKPLMGDKFALHTKSVFNLRKCSHRLSRNAQHPHSDH